MDPDPWNWDIPEIQQFFRQNASESAVNQRGGGFPPLDSFLQALQDQDVDGASLLCDLDGPSLRDDFGITSFRVRRTILQCVWVLQARSQTWRAQARARDDLLRRQTPTPLPTPQLLPQGIKEAQVDVASTEPLSNHIREGEVQIQDAHGRKRRKLDLSVPAVELPQSPHNQLWSASEVDTTGYLPSIGWPIDNIFYTKNASDSEVDCFAVSGTDNSRNPALNFQFSGLQKTCGEAVFIYKSLHHLFTAAERIDLDRNGRQALALLPYNADTQRKARSATVFQFNEQDECVALREDAALMESGFTYAGEAEALTDEWDYLLQHQKLAGATDVLPVYGDSDTESRDAEGSILTTVNDEDEMAEVDDDDHQVHADKAAETIQRWVSDCVTEWTQKRLPKLEATKAWSVWRQMKKSKSIRDVLITRAQETIARLTTRLHNYQEELRTQKWQKEDALQSACGMLEPTVQDIEEQKWMISVWQRRKEPEHIMKPKSTQHKPVHHNHETSNAQSFALHPDDRMSYSPTAAVRDEAISTAVQSPPRQEPANGDENEDFHSIAASPFVVADEDVVADDDHAVDGAQVADDGQASGVAAPVEAGTTPTHDVDNESQDEAIDSLMVPSSPPLPPSVPSPAPMAKDEPTSGSRSSPPKSKHMNGNLSDELPSPSAFVPPTSKRRPAPETPTRNRPRTQHIDLTVTSSDEPTPKKSGKQSRTQGKMSSSLFALPEEATSALVASWEMHQLAKDQDRKRLLIKMLHEAGATVREQLYVYTRDLSQKAFLDRLRRALRAVGGKSTEVEGLDNGWMKSLMHCAKIAVIWHSSKYLDFDTDEIPWMAIYNDDNQLTLFRSLLINFLRMRHTKLFVEPSQPHVIDSDTDDHIPTPNLKRKKRVKASQAGVDSRRHALDRAERRKKALTSSQTEPSQVNLGTDADRSDIEINPGRAEGEEPIYIHPSIAEKMKPHQIDGVRFLWSEITAADEGGAQGCILAHAMGLGKTMQTIALLAVVEATMRSVDPNVHHQLPSRLRPKGARGFRRLRMLILCPPSLLQNWRVEIAKWAGDRLGHVFTIDVGNKALSELEPWHLMGGVMLVGYSMFRSLVNRKENGRISEVDGRNLDKYLLQSADIVVADEAHYLKNAESSVSKAARSIKTQSRIGLTGTPMSNDVQEIFALVSWVAPGYLGAHKEFYATYADPIQAGNHVESTAYEVRRMLKKLAVLRNAIDPKVNRAAITVLRGSLKPKVEFVLFVPLTPLQMTVYSRTIKALNGIAGGSEVENLTLFSWLAVLMLLTNHPTCLRRKLMAPPALASKRRASVDQLSATESGCATPAAPVDSEVTILQEPTDAQNDTVIPGEQDAHALGFSEATINAICEDLLDNIDPAQSAKTSIFLQILQHSRDCEDKVLVFSTSIQTLNYLEDLLNATNVSLGRIDGTTKMSKRTQLLDEFHRGRFDVMLISTKAGGVGLNIACANRVVIFDFGFNPTWEEQAIGRAYRLGQTKPVFVYRFVASGTFEANVYNKQLFKTSLASRVVDKMNPRRSAERNLREWLYEPRDVRQEDLNQWKDKDPDVLDKILDEHGAPEDGKRDTWIRAIKTMETLQEDARDLPLTESEVAEVDEEIKLGLTRKTAVRKAAMAASSRITAEAMLARSAEAMASQQAAEKHRTSTQQPSRPQPAQTFQAPPATMPAQQPQQAQQGLRPEPFMGGMPRTPVAGHSYSRSPSTPPG